MSSALGVPAARAHVYGQPLIVEAVQIDRPLAGERLVELAYAGVNPFDGYNARGLVAHMAGTLPRTLGGEAAGWCDGEPVLVSGHGLGLSRDGLWAGAAIVPTAAVTSLPDGVDLVRAATLGSAGLTAWFGTEEIARVGTDDRVVVLGASGGVGQMVVSLARLAGAEVCALVGTAAKANAVETLCATRVLVGGPEQLASTEPPTVVFDGLAGDFAAAAVEALAPGGQLISYGVTAGARTTLDMQAVYRKGLRITGFSGMQRTPEQTRRGLNRLVGLVQEGALRFDVSTVPLAQVNDALERLQSRNVVGKLVLDLAS